MAGKQDGSNGFDLKEWVFNQLDLRTNNKKKKSKIPRRTHFTIWYVIIVFFVLSIVQQLFLASSIQDIS